MQDTCIITLYSNTKLPQKKIIMLHDCISSPCFTDFRVRVLQIFESSPVQSSPCFTDF